MANINIERASLSVVLLLLSVALTKGAPEFGFIAVLGIVSSLVLFIGQSKKAEYLFTVGLILLWIGYFGFFGIILWKFWHQSFALFGFFLVLTLSAGVILKFTLSFILNSED